MKILALGDPHGNLEKVKEIPVEGLDLILLTGDIGKADLARKFAFENVERERLGLKRRKVTKEEDKAMSIEIYDSTMKIINYLSKIAPVCTIYGNVEPYSGRSASDKKLGIPFLTDVINRKRNVSIINNKLLKIEEVRIGGLKYFIDTSWVKDFKPKDYTKMLKSAKKESDIARNILARFGKVDVLVCHQPPYGVLDQVTAKFAPKHWRGKHAGSKVILEYVKRTQPRYVFCGHIHEGEGFKKVGKSEVYNLGVGGYKIIQV